MILSGQQLNVLHRNLCGRISQSLGYDVTISAGPNWKRAAPGAAVVFELSSLGQSVCTDSAERVRGQFCPAIPVFRDLQFDPTAWTSWHEEWRPGVPGQFGLVSAAWTFYWGTYVREKTQLFRAEWDTLERPRGQAAQPHWHIDRKLIAIVQPRSVAYDRVAIGRGELEELDTTANAPALEEIAQGPASQTDEALQELDLAHLHLGMAGWGYSATGLDCWRRPLSSAADIVDWADNALSLSMGELARLRDCTSICV